MDLHNRILAVDDDSDARFIVETYLGKHGFEVKTVSDGGQMRGLLEQQSFDMFVLDIALPGEDGLSLAKYLRDRYGQGVGIIMLTASGEVVDRIVGLEVGADDYLPKPFEPRELLARIKSILRRHESTASTNSSSAHGSNQLVKFGRFVLDLDAHELLDEENSPVSITTMEFALLKAFATNPDKVLNRDQLLNLAHSRDWDPYDRSIDIRIARLRKKIERDPSKPEVIRTIRGVGYMFASGKKKV